MREREGGKKNLLFLAFYQIMSKTLPYYLPGKRGEREERKREGGRERWENGEK